MRTLIGFLLVVAFLAGAGLLAARYLKPAGPDIPTVQVRRGDFLVKTYTRGDLRAVNSSLVVAPTIMGGGLQITELPEMGATVKKGDVVLAFESADVQNHLEMHKWGLNEAAQQINSVQAVSAIREQSDRVDMMRAEFAVRRAELDVSRNELVSEIDAKKNLLTLEATRKRLEQEKQDMKSREKSSAADLAVFQERYNRESLDAKQAESDLDRITIRSPMDGMAGIRQNRGGDFMYPGMEVPDYAVGDPVGSGDTVLDVVDNSEMEVSGRIPETERGNLNEGQDVNIRLDALPGETFPGKVKRLAGITSRGQHSFDPTKSFDVVFSLTKQDSRLRSGLSSEVEIITERVQDAVYVPLQAVFEKEGKKWVFIRSDGKFLRQAVTTGRRSESQTLITSGLKGGEHIALLDPEARAAGGKKSKNPLASGPGSRM
jgi:RND family efflux transporter MFP subunit